MPELCTHAVLAVGFLNGKRTGGGTPAGTRPAVFSLVSKRTVPNNVGLTAATTLTNNGPAAQAAMKKARRTGITKC